MKNIVELAYKFNDEDIRFAEILFEGIKEKYIPGTMKNKTIHISYIYKSIYKYSGITDKKEKWKIIKIWRHLGLITLKQFHGIVINKIDLSIELGGRPISKKHLEEPK